MATISSTGIGSGLDVKSIVSQLVALEKQPLTNLKVKAATVNTKISAFGQIKSLVSTLSSAVGTLNSLTTWNAVSATSSNDAAVGVSAIGGTQANNFSVQVMGLAKSQSNASQALTPAGMMPGAGTLQIQLGKWSAVGGTFTPGTATAVDITVAVDDTVSSIASKINGAGAGVSATVLTDASGERLLLRSTATGVEAGFKMSVTADTSDGTLTDNAGLSRLVYEATPGSTMTQIGTDATAKLNGIDISSATNTFSNVVSGVTLTAKTVMTSAAEITVTPNQNAITDAVNGFVKAYNDINQSLQDLTKYDAGTKTAGLLQGDTTAVGLQRALQGILQSNTTGAAYARLADIGISQQMGGDLVVDSSKLSTALQNGDEVKKFFTTNNNNDLTNGMGLKLKKFATGLLATDGFFSSKDAALKRALEANTKDQQRVNEKASRVEAALNRRYGALDAQMASLNALNAYVGQQVTMWNKSTA
ncbi:MAG: fliD [Comamonadaceae bacterium]|nr:MAG: fliD [Comamonadaceae bacterium]